MYNNSDFVRYRCESNNQNYGVEERTESQQAAGGAATWKWGIRKTPNGDKEQRDQ